MDASPFDEALDALDEIPLRTLDDKGKAPRERLRKPEDLRSIFARLRDDDRISAFNRALCQSLLDGEPPYSQQELDESGQSEVTNLNFQGAELRLERAKAPYYKLIHSNDTLLSVKTYFGDESQRSYYEAVIAEELSRMIRQWDKFPYETERLIHKHVWDGVGITFWPDDRDWKFTTGGLGQFYFPRHTAATENGQVIVCRYDEYDVPELYRKIEDEDEAEEAGWAVDEVKRAIRTATAVDPSFHDWERLMDEVKNNDLSTGSKAPKIYVIHGLVEEFDGTVSHYLTTETQTDSSEKAYMYKARGVFQSMSEALVLFPYSTGTNSKIHGIRGLGYKTYAFEHQRNRSICRLIDKGYEASATMIQAGDEEALLNSGLEYFGNLAVLQPGFNVVQRSNIDLQASVMPAIQLMDRLAAERASGYSSENVFDGDQRKTKFEVAAHLDQSAALNDANLDFFYTPWRRVLQQVTRRVSQEDYMERDPGGKEVHELYRRLERRQVPVEALYELDHKETLEVRAIGSGSAASRTMALERLGALYGRMDDVGKQNYNRDVAVDIVNASNAGRYFPAQPGIRTTEHTSIAQLQNEVLLNGGEIPVLGSDNHLAHGREHLKPLMELYQAAEGGQIDLAQAATKAILLYEHTVAHVEQIGGDEASVEEANLMKQMLQRIGEIISNGLKEAEAQAREAQEQGAVDGQADQGPSVEQQERFAKAQAEIQIMQQKAQIEQQIKLQNAEVERGIKDANAAAEIRRKTMLSQVT